MNQQTLISFRVAAHRLALPIEDIRRVAPVPLLGPPIGAPQFVEGFFDFLGAPVAVVRLDRLMGLAEEDYGLYTPLILLADEEQPIALHVQKLDSFLKISQTAIQPIGSDETFNGCVTGRVNYRGDTVYAISKRNLLLTAERQKLASHQIMKQRRLDALNANAINAA